MTVKKELLLEGLGCANCAAKIEREVNNLPEVHSATVNFNTKMLKIHLDEQLEWVAVKEKVFNIVHRIEEEVVIVDKEQGHSHDHAHDHHHDEGLSIWKWARIGVGLIVLIVAMVAPIEKDYRWTVYLGSYLLIGMDVLIKAIKNILKGQVFDENFLMGIATVGAFSIGEFAEGASVMLFYEIGEFFQDLAIHRSRKSISTLMDIRPDYANLITKEGIQKVSPEEVGIESMILVKPGEKIPLDGIVVEGNSLVDTSALTGEAKPWDVEPGSSVLSGTINKSGLLTISVTKTFSESTVSKILDMVQNAGDKKAPTERFITKFARYYTPTVVIIAAALSILPPIILGDSFSEWLHRALIFLVVSCPCALVISIPLGFFGGIGGASKQGILVKGSNFLEALKDVDTVVFDKTGTLTKGNFEVSKVEELHPTEGEELLEFAALAEHYSNHPIAVSIQKAYKGQLEISDITEHHEIAGRGISALIRGRQVLAGNEKLMESHQIPGPYGNALGTLVHLAIDGIYRGYILITDEIKTDSPKALEQLRSLGIKRLIMLTGDRKDVAGAIGKSLGMDEVYGELLPHEKVEKLEAIIQNKGTNGKLAFMGDGINDAPVLARADVGIAMGGLGSDAAIEAADIVIMTDEPSKLASAIKIAKRTQGIVWQNILFAFAVKGFFLVLATFGYTTMWEAVFADVGVALLAVLNATRVLQVKQTE